MLLYTSIAHHNKPSTKTVGYTQGRHRASSYARARATKSHQGTPSSQRAGRIIIIVIVVAAAAVERRTAGMARTKQADPARETKIAIVNQNLSPSLTLPAIHDAIYY